MAMAFTERYLYHTRFREQAGAILDQKAWPTTYCAKYAKRDANAVRYVMNSSQMSASGSIHTKRT